MKNLSFTCKIFGLLLIFFFPTSTVSPLLRFLGFSVGPRCRIGFSIVWCSRVGLASNVQIGHFNLILVDRLLMRSGACVGRLNVVKGPFDVILKKRAAIGNSNRVLRAPRGVTYGRSQLWLGELSKITANHRVDCTSTVKIGSFSTIAGASSQIWTHGYIHELSGPGRYRIDGRVDIGANVYVGSACLVSMGVKIANGVIVGGGTTVSKSLLEPALYVSASLRQLPLPRDPSEREDLIKVEGHDLVETVFRKRNA